MDCNVVRECRLPKTVDASSSNRLLSFSGSWARSPEITFAFQTWKVPDHLVVLEIRRLLDSLHTASELVEIELSGFWRSRRARVRITWINAFTRSQSKGAADIIGTGCETSAATTTPRTRHQDLSRPNVQPTQRCTRCEAKRTLRMSHRPRKLRNRTTIWHICAIL